jgi:hypothetical protein
MNNIESEILNFLDFGAQFASKLVAAANPAYAGLSALVGAALDHANTLVNPAAVPVSDATVTAVASAVPVVAAEVSTVGSGAATAPQKAAAVTGLLQEAMALVSDIQAFLPISTAKTPSA